MSSPSQRIAVNTFATYLRMGIISAMALLSSRWVLGALGQADFGLFAVVGGLIPFITLLNGVLAASIHRHLAFAIGQGDPDILRGWFRCSLYVQACVAVLLQTMGWFIGDYALHHILAIPPERFGACVWVFRFSLSSASIAVIAVPFMAAYVANQRIAEQSIWQTIQAAATFALAYVVGRVANDRLIFYSGGLLLIGAVCSLGQMHGAYRMFPECGLSRRATPVRAHLRELLAFSGWNLFGNAGSVLGWHGVAILINRHFDPSVNAAQAIAGQVSGQVKQVSQAMVAAMIPEITAAEGRGDRPRMIDLAMRVSKMGLLLALLPAVPFLIEARYILDIWLEKVPLYAVDFCRIVVSAYLIDTASAGYMIAVGASGRIAAYQATLGTWLMLVFPMSSFLIRVGFGPRTVLAVVIISSLGLSMGRVWWGRRLLNIPANMFVTGIVGRCLLVALPAAFVGLLLHLVLPASPLRIILVTIVSFLTNIFCAWEYGLDSKEKQTILSLSHDATRWCQKPRASGQ